MSWYRTGTISLTNGSANVTGNGTNFLSADVHVGFALIGPDGHLYEVQQITSATALTLAEVYLGATTSGQPYAIVPTRSITADLVSQVQSLIGGFQGIADNAGAGRFGDGSVAVPGLTFTNDQDNGFYRADANAWGASVAGVMGWLLTSSALEINKPITGAAVQSDTVDDTAGRALLVGAFGLGGDAPTVADIDGDHKSGFYKTDGTTANIPTGFPHAFGALEVQRTSSTVTKQVWRANYPLEEAKTYERRKSSGSWGDWVLAWNANSLPVEVGTFQMRWEDESSNGLDHGVLAVSYARAGNMVTCHFSFANNIDTTGLTAGDKIRIPLPFTNAQTGFSAAHLKSLTPSGPFMFYAPSGEAYAYIRDLSTNADLLVSDITSGTSDLVGGTLVMHI